jgi:hypothetical protein
MSNKIENAEKLETVTKQSNFSTMLNGVGSGVMVAGAIPYAYRFIRKSINPEFSMKHFDGTLAFSTVLGAFVGAVYSFNEVKHLNAYREALANDLRDLHAKIDGKTTEPAR